MARKISPVQRLLYILEYVVVVPLVLMIQVMPWAIAIQFSRFLGKILYLVDERDKKIARRNLDVVFADKPLPAAEKERIIKSAFIQMGRLAVETVKIGDLKTENYEKYVRLEGYEHIAQALSHGKGLLVLTAHFGNWEFLGSVPAKLNYQVAAIINKQFNPYTDTLIRRIRETKAKMDCFYNSISDLTKITRYLKKGGIIAIVADQTYYFRPIFVPFFGRTSATADGPAKWHLKFGAPILMAYSVLEPDGKYRLIYEEPKIFTSTGDMEKDAITVMTWVNQQYERMIRKYPEQWFSLFHDRWERTRPEDFGKPEDNPD